MANHSTQDSMPLTKLLHNRWLAIAVTIICCVLAAFFSTSTIHKQLDKKDQQYGQALANLAAKRAIQSSLNLDLVSLQVILQEIAENPSVTNVTIHDVENNLLVQATSSQTLNRRQSVSRQTHFTSPINVHDSVTGYVTVSIDFHEDNSHQRIYGLFCLLALAIIAGILAQQSWTTKTNTSEAENKPVDNSSNNALPIVDKLPQAEETEEDTSSTLAGFDKKNPRIELILRFQNLRTLYGQLNHRSFRSVIQRIEIQLRDLIALYSGELTQINADTAHITFRNNALTEAAFSAICSAHLMTTLNQQPENIHLSLACLIVKREPDAATLKHLAFNLFKQDTEAEILNELSDGQILIESELLADTHSPALSQRIAFSEESTPSSNTAMITEVKEPYASLLEKQLAQLKNY